jgi:hypothetical protein
VPAWTTHRVVLDKPSPGSLLPALLLSSAAYVVTLLLCQLCPPPSPLAARLHSQTL